MNRRSLGHILLIFLASLAALPAKALEIKPVVRRPCLVIDAADIPEVKRRLEALPHRPAANPREMDPLLYGLLYGDEAFKKRVSADFMANLHKKFTLHPGPDASNRRYNEVMWFYDVVASFGCLTEADHKEVRDRMVAGAIHFIGDDPANFPRLGRDNRSTDTAIVGALAGLSFPDHPLAKAWVEFGVKLFRDQLDNGVFEGAWNEVPRYHNWNVLLYSGIFQALQRRAGVDLYQHPNMKAMLDWYVRFSSPRVRFPETTKHNPAGEPTLPVWGDSNYGPHFQVCAMFAPHYVKTDPAFSKRLMWMWRRAGSPFQHGWHFDLLFPFLVDPTLPDEPQTLGSAFCRRLGYVLLRSGFDRPDETAVIMRGGKRGALHPRADLGSIDLFSHGIPLALGSQSGPYHDPEIAWNRSQQSNNDVVFGAKSRDRVECSGTIDAFYTSPQVDYAVADCSRPVGRGVKPADSFFWRRHLLLVKRPDYLVMWDEISSPMSSEWFLHTTAEKLVWGEHRVTSHTAYNADLDVHVLSPAAALVPNEREGPFGGWLYDNPKVGKSDPYLVEVVAKHVDVRFGGTAHAMRNTEESLECRSGLALQVFIVRVLASKHQPLDAGPVTVDVGMVRSLPALVAVVAIAPKLLVEPTLGRLNVVEPVHVSRVHADQPGANYRDQARKGFVHGLPPTQEGMSNTGGASFNTTSGLLSIRLPGFNISS